MCLATDDCVIETLREASNCHKLLRSKAAVVNVMVKRRDVDHVKYG